jgi:hypothetical protein
LSPGWYKWGMCLLALAFVAAWKLVSGLGRTVDPWGWDDDDDWDLPPESPHRIV